MAQANVTIIPFTGKTTEDFNQFEELLRGIIGVAGIAGPQQANFLHLHLKDDALSFFQQLPVAVRTDLDQSLAALRTRFGNNGLREIHVLKLENQKFDTKTDTPENFLVQLQALAKKSYPTPVIPAVAPIDAHAADAAAEAARFATETATNVTTLAEAETFKNNQIRRVFIKARPGWLRSELMERPAIDTIHDLCTFASRQITIRDICRKDDYPEDGFNQIENPVSDTLITVLSKISQTQENLQQKITDMSNNANKKPDNSQAKPHTAQSSISYDQQTPLGQLNRNPNSFRLRPPRFQSNNFQQRQQRPWYRNHQNQQTPQNLEGNQMFRGPSNANGWYNAGCRQQPGMNRQQNQYSQLQQQSQQHMPFTRASQIVCHNCGYPNH